MSEVRDRYQDPDAFRTALTQRLRRLAESSPWTLAELQRQFAYDRFLQRLNAGDDGWVLKGAAALLAREVSTRATRDVDLYRRAELVEAETALREAVAMDLGDWFTFEAGRSRQMTTGVIGLTIALTARIGNREWERFNVDLVGEAAGNSGQGSDRPRGDSPLRSPISAGRDRRAPSPASGRDIVLPARFGIPDMGPWSRRYPIEARKVRGLTEQTLTDAVSVVRNFVDPILSGTATGSLDPVTLRWRRRF